MANPIVFPAELSYVGLAKESSNGTAVAPTRFVPFTKFDPVDDNGLLIDDAMYGSMTSENGAVAGKRQATGDLATYFLADAAGDLLYNILGGYAVGAAVSGVYPHTFSLLNSGDAQPPAHTFTDRQGVTATVGARAYAYACLSELTFSGNATGLVTMEAKWTSFGSAAAGAAPTNATTTETVVPGWRSTVTVAGVAAPIREWTVTLARTLKVDQLADGTQQPNSIARSDLAVSGKLTFAARNEQPVIDFLAGTQQAVVVTIDNGGTLTNVRKLTATMTKAVYDTEGMDRVTPIGYQMGYKALANTTDVGASAGRAPISCLLNNAVTTY
jgi:hypothetical protein